jgi:hypothetical protein
MICVHREELSAKEQQSQHITADTSATCLALQQQIEALQSTLLAAEGEKSKALGELKSLRLEAQQRVSSPGTGTDSDFEKISSKVAGYAASSRSLSYATGPSGGISVSPSGREVIVASSDDDTGHVSMDDGVVVVGKEGTGDMRSRRSAERDGGVVASREGSSVDNHAKRAGGGSGSGVEGDGLGFDDAASSSSGGELYLVSQVSIRWYHVQ